MKQLWLRLGLIVKRRLIEAVATRTFRTKSAIARDTKPAVSVYRSRPYFAPRRHLVVTNSNVHLLNVKHPLTLPLDWHPATRDRLWLFNLHYMEFLEGLEDEECWQYMVDWISSNHPYTPGEWLNSWNSYVISVRVVVWMQQLAIRKSEPSQVELVLIHRSLLAQVRFLRKNLERDIRGNHLIKNAKALLWASTWFQLDECADWRRTGELLLQEIIDEQILGDGVHYELSPAYHCQAFADLLECYQVLEPGPVKTKLSATLEKMAQAVADFEHPDHHVSLFSDSGLHMAYSPSECLDVYRTMTGLTVEPRRHISFPDAGYFGMRTVRHYCLVDCAAMAPDSLPAHGHGDALSFEWTVGKQRIVIDPGVYEYTAGELRDFSKATSSHNTVTLDDLDQSEFWMSFRAGRRARIVERSVSFSDRELAITGAHDGYEHLQGNPIHRRKFRITPGGISIHDEIIGGNSQSVVARLMLDPKCKVQRRSRSLILCSSGDVSVEISSPSGIEIVETFCFLDFGYLQPTKQLVVNIGIAPCAGTIDLRIRN